MLIFFEGVQAATLTAFGIVLEPGVNDVSFDVGSGVLALFDGLDETDTKRRADFDAACAAARTKGLPPPPEPKVNPSRIARVRKPTSREAEAFEAARKRASAPEPASTKTTAGQEPAASHAPAPQPAASKARKNEE